MSIDCDPAIIEYEAAAIEDDATAQGGPMTLDAARSLAAVLAPHLAALRAVTAGTCFERGAGIEVASEPVDSGSQPTLSPTTMIFIAGMLERVSA